MEAYNQLFNPIVSWITRHQSNSFTFITQKSLQQATSKLPVKQTTKSFFLFNLEEIYFTHNIEVYLVYQTNSSYMEITDQNMTRNAVHLEWDCATTCLI